MNLRQQKFRTRFKVGQIVSWSGLQFRIDQVTRFKRDELVLISKVCEFSFGRAISSHVVNAKELSLVRGVGEVA